MKLRLAKGEYRFDAIFFSATAAACGVAPGMRVDVAFHLQVNEFRGVSSVQLQLVDLRPAAGPSQRERECLELIGTACLGTGGRTPAAGAAAVCRAVAGH